MISDASISATQPPKQIGGITVTVTDFNGKTIAGASVSSTSTPSGQAALSGVSGSNGQITFSGVASGSYKLQVSKSGYVANSGTVSVTAGSTENLSITLQTQSTGGTPSGGSSGGVPGYTYEEILAGIVLGVVVLVWLRRRQ